MYEYLVMDTNLSFSFTKTDSCNRGDGAAGGSSDDVDLYHDLELKIIDKTKLVKAMNAKKPEKPTIIANLQGVLKKVLTTARSEDKSDTITASMSVFDKNYSQEMRIRLTGGLLSSVFSEYNEPMDIYLHLFFKEPPFRKVKSVKVVFMKIRPSLSKDGDYVFENVAPVEETYQLKQQRKVKFGTQYVGEINISLRPLTLGENTISVPSVRNLCTNLLENPIEYDFALVSDSGCGKRFPCHRIFLGAHSTVFAQMLKTDFKEGKEGTYPISLSEDGVAALLKFFYVADFQEAVKNPSVAFELLGAADKYDIPALGKAMKALFLDFSIGCMDLDVALQLYIFTSRVDGNDQLRWKAIQVLKSKADEFAKSDFMDELFKTDPSIMKEIMRLGFKIGSTSYLDGGAQKK